MPLQKLLLLQTNYLITNLKKMKGFKAFYRIKLGDYRIGFELINKNTVYFVAVSHRKDIYKTFP
jgi:mRNA interferase RelE/StbE